MSLGLTAENGLWADRLGQLLLGEEQHSDRKVLRYVTVIVE